MKLHQDTFRPELVTKAFEEEFFRQNPEEINDGWCFQWAYMAYIAFNDVELCSVPGHAFIKYKGKYYDSERLNGVDDWMELPTMKYCGRWISSDKKFEPVTEAYFIREWEAWGTDQRPGIKNVWKYYESLIENLDDSKVWHRESSP